MTDMQILIYFFTIWISWAILFRIALTVFSGIADNTEFLTGHLKQAGWMLTLFPPPFPIVLLIFTVGVSVAEWLVHNRPRFKKSPSQAIDTFFWQLGWKLRQWFTTDK